MKKTLLLLTVFSFIFASFVSCASSNRDLASKKDFQKVKEVTARYKGLHPSDI